jgi:hypothetical protein
MNKQFEEACAHIQAKLRYIKSDTRSIAGALLETMQQTFTVVNKIEPVVSSKALEIFYYVPVEDDITLQAVKDCICLTWLQRSISSSDFDLPVSGQRAAMTKDISYLPLKWRSLPTRMQLDELYSLGVNYINCYARRQLYLEGIAIWRHGKRVEPASFPVKWNEMATMAVITEQISYATVLRIENPQWSR